MGARACQGSHEYDRGSHDPSDEHRTSCFWSGGGDSNITMSSRQRGHEKQIVRNECLVRQGAGYGVNATEGSDIDCCAGAPRAHARGQQESRGGADDPKKDVFSHVETIQQVTSLIINTKGTKGTDIVKKSGPTAVRSA